MNKFILLLVLFALFISCKKSEITQETIAAKAPAEKAKPHWRAIEGQVRYGDNLQGILAKHQVDRNVAYKITQAFQTAFDVRRIKPGKKYSLFLDSLSVVQAFEYYPEKEQTVRVLRDSTGEFRAILQKRPLVKKVRSIKGRVRTTLYEAILDLGEKPDLIIAFSDVFQWDVDFFIDPRIGDEFRIVYEKYYLLDPQQPDSLGAFIRFGRILAGQYTLEGKPLTAIYFDNTPGGSGYYDLDGRSFQKTFLKSPLNYRRISSYFSGARRHPILKKVRAHYAIDYAAPMGTPISAAADGTIIDKGYNKGVGNYIKIRHKNPRYVTLYGHMSRFARGIRKGAKVKQRDVIGYVGQTGLATGPHLHYAFYENGRPINPLKIKNTSGDPILAQNRERFERVKKDLLMRLMAAREPGYRSPFIHLHRTMPGLGHVGMPER